MTLLIELAWRKLMRTLGLVQSKRYGHNRAIIRQLVKNMSR
jgi:hypothetical protein